MDADREREVAKEIYRQLGGRRFTVMTGARDFKVVEGGGLAFRLPHFARDRINAVSIKLEASDACTVKFQSIQGANVKEVAVVQDVCCEDLETLFTEHTGLATHL